MSLDLVKKIVKALDDKKGNDIQVIKIEELTIVADYFVIATANSNTHVRALADEVEYQQPEYTEVPTDVNLLYYLAKS